MSANTRSSGNHCVIFGCSNNYRKRKLLAEQTCDVHQQPRRVCGCELFKLHRFPADPEHRRLWISNVNRKNFLPTESSRVCSAHFVSGERTDTNPTPMRNLGYQRKVKVGRRRIMRGDYVPVKKRRLCADEVEPVESEPCTPIDYSQLDGAISADESVESSPVHNQSQLDGAISSDESVESSPVHNQVCKVDAATQWEDLTTVHHTYSAPLKLNVQTPLSAKMSAADLQFYTGISPEVFKKLTLCIQRTPLRPSQLHIADQLLLALMRLRLGLLYRDLASRFGIAPSSVCNIFNNVLKSLKEIMKYVVIWLPRSRIQSTMPSSFIENGFEDTTCIFDCTEVALERPTKQKPRAQTYSSYKAHNTVKFLVAIAPNGLIMYISQAFGGRASDKFIVKQSGVQEYLVPGDVIMADRGFTLDPYLEAQGIKLNMPAFTKGDKSCYHSLT